MKTIVILVATTHEIYFCKILRKIKTENVAHQQIIQKMEGVSH